MTLALMIPVIFLTLVMMLRGGELHNHLVAQAEGILRPAGFDTAREYPLDLPGGGKDFVDLLARRGDVLIGIEVETSARNVLSNVAKARRLNLLLIILVPNQKVRQPVKQTLLAAGINPGEERICVLLLAQLEQEVRNYFHLNFAANGAAEIKNLNQKQGEPSCKFDGTAFSE